MDYKEFKEQFVEAVKDKLEEMDLGDAKVDLQTVNKPNESYEAMTVTPAGGNVGVNMNVNRFYDAVEDGMPFEEAVNRASEMVDNGIAQMPEVDIASLKDYEQMKDKLAMEVVSSEANAELLSTVPHQNMEDMAVVYRFVLGKDDNGMASVVVTNSMLESYGVTPEQLHMDALENAPAIKPVVIQGMTELMTEMMGDDFAALGLAMDPVDEKMFVATVPDKVQGASVIAYQDFMDQAAERLGGECLGLRWEDLNFEERSISVNHNLTDRPDDQGKCGKHIQTPKTEAGTRHIPMLDEVYEAFLAEYEIQKCTGFCEEEIDGYTGFVFSTSTQTVYSASAVNNAIRRIILAYNKKEEAAAKAEKRDPLLLPKFSAHNLRHTFCTRLCENESNLKVIQDIMGHKDISTTMDIYAECTTEKKKEVAAKLEGKIVIR